MVMLKDGLADAAPAGEVSARDIAEILADSVVPGPPVGAGSGRRLPVIQ
jgi:hypothetical protein